MHRGGWLLIGGLTCAWLAVGASFALAPEWDRWQELDLGSVSPAADAWRVAPISGTCRDAAAPGRWAACSRSWTVQRPALPQLEQDLRAAGWERDAQLDADTAAWVRRGSQERLAVHRPTGPADYPVVQLTESAACRSIVDRVRIRRTGARCT